jgi:hypothetical protein
MVLIVAGILAAVSASAYSQAKPVAVSSDPANGATNISRSLAWISITFSKPMMGTCGGTSGNWPGGIGNCSWSLDMTTIRISRSDPNTLIPPGARVTIILNSPPLNNYRDTQGNVLDAYTLSFTVEGAAALERIAANPQMGFSWPYYLYKPLSVKNPPVLMVEPNNTGSTSDDPAVHDAAARDLITAKTVWADDLGVPYLVPTFPRPADAYTHALDKAALQLTQPGLQRIDLQLIAMIQDAKTRLAAGGTTVDARVFMAGASASGSFVSRFVMLHPDVVKAASFGCPGWGPIVPVGQWNGTTLPYPEGISDLETLVGAGFDAATFRSVPLQVWVGDEDKNVDPYWNPTDPNLARVLSAFGGHYLYQRWPRYEAAYRSVGSSCQFVIFPDMGHAWAGWSYIREFFDNNRAAPQPPLPKPLLYKIYFPHVVSDGPWETEIGLVNTVAGGEPVRGKMQAYGKNGGSPLESVDIEIRAGGRTEVTVGKTFRAPANIAYLAFLSDSGFLAGYTRYNQPGNRVSLPASTGTLSGWFPKMEQEGWTGLAFVNIEATAATVSLTAMDENGVTVGEERLTVNPGEKILGLVEELFHFDLKNARYFCFSSDKKVLGFSVSGSGDGAMLDGLPSLAEYIK